MELIVTITHNNGKRTIEKVGWIEGGDIQYHLEHGHYKSISIRLA